MTRTELIIQLLKVAIGLAFGAYFVWWSLRTDRCGRPRIMTPAAPVGIPWRGPSPSGNSNTARQRMATRTREAAMAAVAKF